MDENRFMILVTRFLSGEASAEESESLNSLLKKKKYSALFKIINERWEKTGNWENSNRYNVARGLKLLAAKIRDYYPAFPYERKEREAHIFLFRPRFLKIAASVVASVALIAVASFIASVLEPGTDSIEYNERRTAMGEKVIITLIDGTKITLDADSRLKYPANFNHGKREVYLDGEACFEVNHDDEKPFIVKTGNISVIDLGTKFNINAFPEEDNIVVSLEEGKIEVSTGLSDSDRSEISLKPMQQLIHNKKKETNRIEQFDYQKAFGWKDNVLVFENEPISKVFLTLERSFGVKFSMSGNLSASYIIRANFKNESLWTIAEVIKKATGLTYKTVKEGNRIVEVAFYEY